MNLEVGDKVWSYKYSFGTVVGIGSSAVYPYYVDYNLGARRATYTLKGKRFKEDAWPDIIQRHEINIIEEN